MSVEPFMRKVFSLLVQILGMLLPCGAKRFLLGFALGWMIGEGTKIGCSVILCSSVRIGSNSRIGHFNVFRDLKILEIGNETEILNFNHFMARKDAQWPATLSIGSNSLVTSHHFFDCGGRIRIGNYCCVGGRDSQFWTHLLALRPSGMREIEWRELGIADRCYIGARATLVYCQIPSDSVVGPGAVVTRDFSTEGPSLLVAGNPAEVKKRFDISGKCA
jgi:acetyltransferase-like isoleucine patch superfamily enzyme